MKRRASRIATAIMVAMMSIGVAFGKNHSQQLPNQAATKRQAKPGKNNNHNKTQNPQKKKPQVHAQTSDSDALFFPPLPSGNYLLVIETPGFSKFSQQVVLNKDKLEELKAKLTVSEALVGIVIESEEPLERFPPSRCRISETVA